jgi:prepilin-type N-terminal cleavage/methylation domain-containing protein
MTIIKKHGKKGFTLVEAIVVGAIMAVLAAVAVPMYLGYVRGAKFDSARSACELIGAAIIQTNNRAINVDASDYTDIGISNPSDNNWTFTFPAILGTAAMTNTYAITATGVGSMAGSSGTFLPKQTGTARWTGCLQ